MPAGGKAGDPWDSWVNPTSVLGGRARRLRAAYLAAFFLVCDARRLSDDAMVEYFRRRAVGAGVAAGSSPSAGIFVLSDDAEYLFDGLTSRALPLVILSGCAASLRSCCSCGGPPRGPRSPRSSRSSGRRRLGGRASAAKLMPSAIQPDCSASHSEPRPPRAGVGLPGHAPVARGGQETETRSRGPIPGPTPVRARARGAEQLGAEQLAAVDSRRVASPRSTHGSSCGFPSRCMTPLLSVDDVDFEAWRAIASPDLVATRFTWTALHTGEFNGVPASNRPVRVCGDAFDRIKKRPAPGSSGRVVLHLVRPREGRIVVRMNATTTAMMTCGVTEIPSDPSNSTASRVEG